MIKIDLKNNRVILEEESISEYSLDSPEAFRLVSRAWIRAGWDTKYTYSFTWLGRPIIQLPDDMIRIQEVIYELKPDVIIETGIAHGGSLIFYASLCKLMGKGRIVGVDVEIRPHNLKAITEHDLYPYITLIEGSSIDSKVVNQVSAQVSDGETVLVLLDSCHNKDHVLSELEAYSPLVTAGSYIVAMDGVMEEVTGAPRTNPDWEWNNPKRAAIEFTQKHPDFAIVEPAFLFNEGVIRERVTYWPSAFIKRIK